MYSVSQLFVYPIKSLGGISLNSSEITPAGFKHDRRWMLVDENNEFVSQRTFPQMALLQTTLNEDGLVVQHKKNKDDIKICYQPNGDVIKAKVWSDVCKAVEVDARVSEWFSDMLTMKCKLVYMPDTTKRRVDTRYAFDKQITSFTDGYPFMMIGQSSLNDLNNRLNEKLPINRFRPNIVFTGGAPFEEDEWASFKINNVCFYGVKLCSRCLVTNINQDEAIQGKEPLRTLSGYRKFKNKIYFGQNLLHKGEGHVSVDDSIIVEKKKKGKACERSIVIVSHSTIASVTNTKSSALRDKYLKRLLAQLLKLLFSNNNYNLSLYINY